MGTYEGIQGLIEIQGTNRRATHEAGWVTSYRKIVIGLTRLCAGYSVEDCTMVPPYLLLDELLERVDEPYRSAFPRLLASNAKAFRIARGSTRNHQSWPGGYIDHIQEVMNLGIRLYDCLGQLRPLPFSVSDALTVLFVHDLEKPWAYEEIEGGSASQRGAQRECSHLPPGLAGGGRPQPAG